MPRKTQAQLRQESYEADRRAWEIFLPQLKAATTLKEAVHLYGSTTPPDSPGRSYYSNLGFFLGNLTAPMGANGTELSQYIRLIDCFEKEGALSTATKTRVEAVLRAALAQASTW